MGGKTTFRLEIRIYGLNILHKTLRLWWKVDLRSFLLKLSLDLSILLNPSLLWIHGSNPRRRRDVIWMRWQILPFLKLIWSAPSRVKYHPCKHFTSRFIWKGENHFQEKRQSPGSDFPCECSKSGKRIPIPNGHQEQQRKEFHINCVKQKTKTGCIFSVTTTFTLNKFYLNHIVWNLHPGPARH
jgi:hypothetical protein